MNDYAVKEQPVRINGFVWCDDDDDDGDGNGDGEGDWMCDVLTQPSNV